MSCKAAAPKTVAPFWEAQGKQDPTDPTSAHNGREGVTPAQRTFALSGHVVWLASGSDCITIPLTKLDLRALLN